MGLIKFFGKQALKRFKNSVDELNQALNEIDMENVEAHFNELKEDFNKEFDKLKEKFYTVGKKFVVEIPYDRDTQKLSFKMENGMITVVVETDETTSNGTFVSKSTTTRNIPESVNVNEFKQKYLEDEKKMLFIFKPKKVEQVTENEEVTDDFEPIGEEGAETVSEECEDAREQLIKKMVHMHLNGCSYRKIAQECGVSDKTCKRWINEWLTEHDAAGCA